MNEFNYPYVLARALTGFYLAYLVVDGICFYSSGQAIYLREIVKDIIHALLTYGIGEMVRETDDF